MEGQREAQAAPRPRGPPVREDVSHQGVRPQALRRDRVREPGTGEGTPQGVREEPRPSQDHQGAGGGEESQHDARQDPHRVRRDSGVRRRADVPEVLLRGGARVPRHRGGLPPRGGHRQGDLVPRGQGRRARHVPPELPRVAGGQRPGGPRGVPRTQPVRHVRVPPGRPRGRVQALPVRGRHAGGRAGVGGRPRPGRGEGHPAEAGLELRERPPQARPQGERRQDRGRLEVGSHAARQGEREVLLHPRRGRLPRVAAGGRGGVAGGGGDGLPRVLREGRHRAAGEAHGQEPLQAVRLRPGPDVLHAGHGVRDVRELRRVLPHALRLPRRGCRELRGGRAAEAVRGPRLLLEGREARGRLPGEAPRAGRAHRGQVRVEAPREEPRGVHGPLRLRGGRAGVDGGAGGREGPEDPPLRRVDHPRRPRGQGPIRCTRPWR